VGVTDWNFRHPIDPQDYSWDCAAASLAWALQACGHPLSEQDVILGLGPARISPALGLLDASGAGLVSYLAELGIGASNNPTADWDELVACAGYQPVVMGGRGWYHWSGVRMGGLAAYGMDTDFVALANPADGWMGVRQMMMSEQFDELGDFSVVWFTSW
jgi:hypothetical protein